MAERMAREAQDKAEEARRDHEAEVLRLQRLLDESREEQTEGVAERQRLEVLLDEAADKIRLLSRSREEEVSAARRAAERAGADATEQRAIEDQRMGAEAARWREREAELEAALEKAVADRRSAQAQAAKWRGDAHRANERAAAAEARAEKVGETAAGRSAGWREMEGEYRALQARHREAMRREAAMKAKLEGWRASRRAGTRPWQQLGKRSERLGNRPGPRKRARTRPPDELRSKPPSPPGRPSRRRRRRPLLRASAGETPR